ncbi:MAG: energy transducer TonB [Thermoanaerobaculia bacterium]
MLLLAVGCQSSAPPPADPAGPPYMVISGGPVSPPVALHRVIPKRPEGVTEKGQVLLKTIVGLDGIARNIEVVKTPHPALGEVSAEAVKHWRFTPGTLRGKPVETIFLILITF